MKVNRYLIIGKNPNQKVQTRLSVNYPSLDMYEVAVKLSMELPDSLFRKPLLEASINVPEDAANPIQVDCDVVDNIKTIVSEQLGVELNITGAD